MACVPCSARPVPLPVPLLHDQDPAGPYLLLTLFSYRQLINNPLYHILSITLFCPHYSFPTSRWKILASALLRNRAQGRDAAPPWHSGVAQAAQRRGSKGRSSRGVCCDGNGSCCRLPLRVPPCDRAAEHQPVCFWRPAAIPRVPAPRASREVSIDR